MVDLTHEPQPPEQGSADRPKSFWPKGFGLLLVGFALIVGAIFGAKRLETKTSLCGGQFIPILSGSPAQGLRVQRRRIGGLGGSI